MTKASAHGNIILAFGTRDAFAHGEMAEWSKAPVLKTGDVKASVGSNPTLSANSFPYMIPEFDLRKYPSGRRGSPAKGVGCVKSAAEVQILSSAPSKNLEAITVSRFFLFLVKTFLLRFGIVPSVGYIVGDIVVYFTDFVLQLTLLFIILSWAEDSSSSHEIDSVEYRQWLLHVQNTLAFG